MVCSSLAGVCSSAGLVAVSSCLAELGAVCSCLAGVYSCLAELGVVCSCLAGVCSFLAGLGRFAVV